MTRPNWLHQLGHRLSSKQVRRPRTRLAVETLEDRAVPAGLSIADAAATEGGAAYRFTDSFVASDAYSLAAARDIRTGPDGNVYVASQDTNSVKVFEGGTGRFLRDLSTQSSELDTPWALTFGPDGRLYANSATEHDIVRFNIGTGSYEVFVAANAGGLANSHGMTFGPDGNLYVTSRVENGPPNTDLVKRYSGTTGAYLGDFVTAGSGGLDRAQGIAFGPDGNLYVASRVTKEVKRYNGTTGAFINNFVTAGSGGIIDPAQLVFRGDGYLYVSDQSSPKVYRYSAATGAFVDVFAASPVGTQATGLAFAPTGELYVSQGTPSFQSGSSVARFAPSSFAALTVSLSSASAAPVSVSFATASGTATAGNDYVATSGAITFAPGETNRTILVLTVNDSVAEGTESFTLILTDPVGATIIDGTGVATITDDDGTKFFVVDDASANTTYRYGAPGNGLGSSALNSGNSAPRGATSTAAGDKVWVVDANKSVYVYNAAGGLLGSWSAGSLNANAQVEGIATNGSDVWLVDNKQDKVFRYSGAATRLTGSQNAASNFNLATGNKDPRGLVTDGTHIWVVNNAANDKVFKYTMTGTLVGSWTITGGGGTPTGITLDPSAPSHLWVVDSATDRVYQFDNAVGRASGSQGPSISFALAPGNTNPQDIADPPVRDSAAPAVLAAATIGSNNSPVAATQGLPIGAPPLQSVAHPVRLAFFGVIDTAASTARFDKPVPVTENQNRPVLPVSTGESRKASDDQEKLDSLVTDKSNWLPVDEFDFSPIDVTPASRKTLLV